MSRWRRYDFGSSQWEEIPLGSGCYAIYLDGELGYIGCSINLKKRISHGAVAKSNSHRFLPMAHGKISTSFGTFKEVYIKTSESQKIGEEAMREARLIYRLKPKHNRVGWNKPESFVSPGRKGILGLKKDRPPAFLFYAKDWLDWKVLRMSDAAQGVYIRLLAFMWKDSLDQCSLPDDDKQIARVIGKRLDQWRKIRSEIMLDGDPLFAIENGRLVSHRLQRGKAQQDLRKKRLAEAGKKGASSRWRRDDGAYSEAIGEAIGDANGDAMTSGIHPVPRLSSSSSSSSSDIASSTDQSLDKTSKGVSKSKAGTSRSGQKPRTPAVPLLGKTLIKQMVDGWNSMVKNSPGISACLWPLNSSRRRKLAIRWQEDLFRERWKEIFERIGKSSFCRGDVPVSGKRTKPWVASFDWIIENDDFYMRVLEGKYDDKEAVSSEPKRASERVLPPAPSRSS